MMKQGRDSHGKLRRPIQYFVSASALLVAATIPFNIAHAQTVEKNKDGIPSVTLSGDTETETREEKLRTAVESLSSILGQAKEDGLLRAKGELPTPTTNNMQSVDPSEEALRCENAAILNFDSLIGVETYEDLLLYKNEIPVISSREGMIEFARLTLSLGLGTETKALLAGFQGDDIDLALRLADIVEEPEFKTDNPIFSPYSGCHSFMPIFSLVEKASANVPSFSGVERRELLSGFDRFPKVLKETIAVKLAILAMENDNENIAKSIWRKLDNDARENETLLPIEKVERDEYLYLNALLKKDDDPEYYKAVIKHFAEREGVYQLKSLKKLADMNREKGESNKLIETTLEGIREILPKSSEKKAASYELVKNRIYSGDVTAAIETTKKYFSPSEAEYLESATQLKAIVEALLTDEDSRRRFSGLNNYLFDTLFFEASGDTDTLKYEALSVAIAFGLPQLYKDIVGSQQAKLSDDVKELIKQAQFLIALKANNFELPGNFNSLELSDFTQVDIARQAIAEKNFDAADEIISTLKKNAETSEQTSEIERALALTKGEWSDLFEKSLADPGSETSANGDPLSNILDVLGNSRPAGAVTNGKGWVDKMPQYLTDMDATLQKTKAYLKNG